MDQPRKSTRPDATIFADNVLDRYDLSFLGITPATASANGDRRANDSMTDSRERTLAGSNGADERRIGGGDRTSAHGSAVSQPSTKTTQTTTPDNRPSRSVNAGKNALPGEGQTPFLTEPRDGGVTTNGPPELRRAPRWVGPVWTVATLLIVGLLLGFAFLGNSGSEDGLNTIAIGQMDLGRRVKGENPLLDDVEHLPEPDPATSREVRFEMTKPSGNRSWFKLIWSLDEIAAAGAKVGATVDFNMPELGIIGPARCSYIGPCPEFKEGDGNLVIGVFKHEPDGPIVNVHIEGLEKPIGSTANHPF